MNIRMYVRVCGWRGLSYLHMLPLPYGSGCYSMFSLDAEAVLAFNLPNMSDLRLGL